MLINDNDSFSNAIRVLALPSISCPTGARTKTLELLVFFTVYKFEFEVAVGRVRAMPTLVKAT